MSVREGVKKIYMESFREGGAPPPFPSFAELISLPKKLAECDSDLSALVILVRFVGAKHIQGYCGYFESE